MTNERNETTKTIVFAAAAAVLAGAAYWSQPDAAVVSENAKEAGALFFPELTLDNVKGLEISDYDAKAARTEMFRVEYDKGSWVLPLKENYPADAKDALAKATSWLTTVARDVVVTTDKNQFKDFGVLNPTDEKGTDGVGILFRALDENRNVLADLVVGKEVEGKTGWRYLREPKSDAVYRANVGEFSVSTKFKDWIEKDLLELADAVRTVSGTSEAQREKFKKTLALVQWTDFKLNEDLLIAKVLDKKTETLKFTGGSEWAPQAELQGLAANQETNADKVRDLSDGLRNMHIVDVFSKPPGLGPDLKISKQVSRSDQKRMQELAGRGFYPTENQDVVPIGGELRVETKEGIVYRLRFGHAALLSEEGKVIGAPKEPDAKAAKKDDKDAKGKKDDAAKKSDEDKSKTEVRFVLIAVAFDESKFPPIPDPVDPKPPETKPGEKTDEAANKKQLEQIRQLQKMQTEESRKKRDKDIENGKVRSKELADRYDRWYYLVSNDTYKKLRIEKEAFAKAKEEKKDEKSVSPGFPGILDPSKEAPPVNPNIPTPPVKKTEPEKKEAPAKVESPKRTMAPETKAEKKSETTPSKDQKQAEKDAKEPPKSKDTGTPSPQPPAKKPPSP